MKSALVIIVCLSVQIMLIKKSGTRTVTAALSAEQVRTPRNDTHMHTHTQDRRHHARMAELSILSARV